ncbi:AraC-like DNA-binding protein [Oxalobacteraceae bacterium GrIS 1.11]
MDDMVEYHRVAHTPGLILSEGKFVEFAFERHFHLDYHIGLICEGVQRQQFRGQDVLLGPGCISVMPPGEMHDGHGAGAGGYTLRTFRIAPDLLHGLSGQLFDNAREAHLPAQRIENAALFRHMLGLHQALQHGADLLAQEERWLSMVEHLLGRPEDARAPRFSMVNWGLVNDFCHSHLDAKISIVQLAQLCGLDRFQFLRQFKKAVGMTPHAWLTRLRLERACFTLRHTERLVAEVAQEVGFYDQSHFNRAFRQAYGVPPSRY